MANLTYILQSVRGMPRPGWRDALLFVAFFALLVGTLHLTKAMHAPFSPEAPMEIDLSPLALPGYAARSLLRMFLAFGASILFTLVYGYVAAYNRSAEKVLVPLLDILQSVPVLGFLSVTVTGFMALFPGSLMGLECASLFAIFTGQAWNMTFSFYQSLRTIPKELREASTVYQLTWWQRFIKLEVPFSMISLVWNGMMSFGGGWFFLAASEAISVLNHQFKLPGIGSYMATAVDKGDMRAVAWAVVTMVTIVVLVDQLFWRPIVAWAQKFKFEQTESGQEPTSAVLDLLRKSVLLPWLEERVFAPLGKRIDRLFSRSAQWGQEMHLPPIIGQAIRIAFTVALVGLVGYGLWRTVQVVGSGFTWMEALHVAYQGLLTLLRVAVMVIVATVVWTPIGVWIGFSPRLARIAQPLVQIGASFPANLIFPVVVLLFIKLHIALNWGSILLLALGTQWYILFNVIAGATAVPGDLREAAVVFRLRNWTLWRTLILPAIFPAWVTGALTAAGGAWNASIVAEVASWGTQKLQAEGLGAYIAQATEAGHWPQIIVGIAIMSLYVVLLNRFVWRPLYGLAETRYRLD
ncbi:MAG TPA: ABC transporter permease subunit [Chthonomonadaceae bacterium]|nr:ABC transporter permease subunit [Chthonomonadaceae bacterium]